jgi:hypothetical protein
MESITEGIENLDEYTGIDLDGVYDTPPDAIIVWFDVIKEYMPAKSREMGFEVYENFVHRFYIKELGYSSGNRRIKDEVYFNKESNSWHVKRLAKGGQSDILKFKGEWNKFVRGSNGVEDGTSIKMLFKNDPSRADMYVRSHITTIERLAGLTEADCQRGGMGWLDDKKRAEAYLKKAKENAGSIQNLEYVRALEEKNAAQAKELADLKSQFEMFLSSQIEARQNANIQPLKKLKTPKKPAKSAKKSADDSELIEGLDNE